jgi:hypothetical protein
VRGNRTPTLLRSARVEALIMITLLELGNGVPSVLCRGSARMSHAQLMCGGRVLSLLHGFRSRYSFDTSRHGEALLRGGVVRLLLNATVRHPQLLGTTKVKIWLLSTALKPAPLLRGGGICNSVACRWHGCNR